MERIVLDTNCLLQIISYNSQYNVVWDRIRSGEVALCVSTDILLEYTEILTRFISVGVADNIVNTIKMLPNTEYIKPRFNWAMLPDPDDNKFVDCAVTADAKYIVSDDKHFKVLKKKDTWPKVDLKTLKEYHKHLTNDLSGIKKRKRTTKTTKK